MRERIIFCVVLICSNYALAIVDKNNCDNCIRMENCTSATDLVTLNDYEAIGRMICGFEEDYTLKVCCPNTDDIESHPNLRLLPEECGGTNLDKIIGGRVARLYEYPWMVLLSYNKADGLQFDCGGTLINERYVLTAAHCVFRQRLAGVRVGDLDYNTQEDCEGEPPLRTCETYFKDKRIESTIIHPEYESNKNKEYDIALVRLQKKARFTRNVRTVCLPVSREQRSRYLEGLNATIAGWGFTNRESKEKSSKLMTVEVPITSQESCLPIFGSVPKESFRICAGKAGVDSCGGDSGGPLMVQEPYKGGIRLVQYGVIVLGTRDCGIGHPARHADVAKHMKWILDNITP